MNAPFRDLLASEFPLMNDRSIIDPIPYLVKRFLKIPTDQKIAGIFLPIFWNYFRFLVGVGGSIPHSFGLVLPIPKPMPFKFSRNLSQYILNIRTSF